MRPKLWVITLLGLILLGLGISAFILRDTLASEAQITKLSLALQHNPTDFDAAFGLGVAYFRTHDYTKAVEFYTRATKINPASAEAQNNLGNTYRKELRFEDAESSYLEVLNIAPTYTTTYVNLVNLYNNWPKDKGNKLAEIPKVLLKGLDASPNNPTLLHELIDYYHQVGDTANAIKYQKQLDSL